MATETRVIHLESDNLSDLYDETQPLALSRDIYYAFAQEGVYLAHVCIGYGRPPSWIWSCASAHTLVSRGPLHLEPSIGWQDCCGRHGFIREGVWIPANDQGWFPDAA